MHATDQLLKSSQRQYIQIKRAGSSLNMVGTNLFGGHNLSHLIGIVSMYVSARTWLGQIPMSQHVPACLQLPVPAYVVKLKSMNRLSFVEQIKCKQKLFKKKKNGLLWKKWPNLQIKLVLSNIEPIRYSWLNNGAFWLDLAWWFFIPSRPVSHTNQKTKTEFD